MANLKPVMKKLKMTSKNPKNEVNDVTCSNFAMISSISRLSEGLSVSDNDSGPMLVPPYFLNSAISRINSWCLSFCNQAGLLLFFFKYPSRLLFQFNYLFRHFYQSLGEYLLMAVGKTRVKPL